MCRRGHRAVTEVLTLLTRRTIHVDLLRRIFHCVGTEPPDAGQRFIVRRAGECFFVGIMPHLHADILFAKGTACGQDQLEIAHAAVVVRNQHVIAARQRPELLIDAVAAHGIADMSVVLQFFAAADGDLCAGQTLGTQRQTADTFKSDIAVERNGAVGIDRAADRCWRDLINIQLFCRLCAENIVGMLAQNRTAPRAVIVIGTFKSDLGRAAVEVLGKLRIVAELACTGISCVIGVFPGRIGYERFFSVTIQRRTEHLSVIGGNPDAVVKSLIIGVYRDQIVALVQILCDIKCVVIIVERITGGRSLCHEDAVDIQLVIVVCRQIQNCLFGNGFQRERTAEQNVSIFKGGIMVVFPRFCLAVEDIQRFKAGKVRCCNT